MSRLDKRPKMKKTTRMILIGLAVILVVAIGGYTYRSTHYSNHFLPDTFINGTEVSGLTAKQANDLLHERYDAQEFTIEQDGQEWKSLKKADLGLSTDFSDELETMISQQNNWRWGLSSLSTSQQNLALDTAAFDKQTLNKQTETLSQDIDALNDDRTETENAKIDKDEDGFTIEPEKQGDELDTKQATKAFKADLLDGQNELELNSYTKEPTVTSDDEDLQKELDELNEVAQTKGTYQINGKDVEIPTEKIMDWLTYEDDEVTIDQDKVREYVEELGEKYNTSENGTKFDSTKRDEVNVKPGTLSWTIATDQETKALSEDILKGEDFNRAPAVEGSADPSEPLVDDTYVEVDLENQHMWYYKDGEVSLDTDIVSGKPKTKTPTGVFYVWNKERDATLTGEDYESPVDYWLPIDWTGVGIHDADWQPTFGGDRWKEGGSHGCINTPPGVMEELFEDIEVGTPVIVI
ncbi:MAG: L,D-transpeptidase/peptidoglycan binding protein [Tetragenococcus sp.]|nr:L,D-transpeptidase/peptidoglycan binding protein [Tetragenococcus sp.]